MSPDPHDLTGGYVPMPLGLLYADLSDGAKMLWAVLYLYSRTGAGDMFEMSTAQMATLSGSTPPSTRRRRLELIEAGWLEAVVVRSPARRTLLTVKVAGHGADHDSGDKEP